MTDHATKIELINEEFRQIVTIEGNSFTGDPMLHSRATSENTSLGNISRSPQPTLDIPNNVWDDDSVISCVRWQLDSQQNPCYSSVSENVNYYGYHSQDFLSKQITWFDIVEPDYLDNLKISYQTFYDSVSSSITPQADIQALTYKVKNKHGNSHWVRDLLSAVKNPDGTILYFQSFILDVTEEKENILDLKQQHRYMHALHETALGMMNRLDINSLMDTMVMQFSKLTGNPDAYLFLHVEKEDKLELVAASGIFKLDLGRKIVKGEGASGTVWETKKAVFIKDYSTFASRINFQPFENFKSAVSVPLLSSDVVRGVMGFATNREENFDSKSTNFLTGFAQLAVMALDNAQLYKTSQNSQRELELLDKLSRAIINHLDLSELLNNIAYTIATIFDYCCVSLSKLEENRVYTLASYDLQQTADSNPTESNLTNSRNLSENLEFVKEILTTGKPQFLKIDSHGCPISYLLVPLKFDSKTSGILCVGSKNKELNQDDQRLMQKAIDQIQIAINNAKLHEIVQKDVIRSNALYKISQAIQETDQLKNFMNIIVETTREAVAPRWIILYKINMKAGIIEEIATTKTSPLRPLSFERLQEGFIGRAITSQKTVFLKKDSPVDGIEGIKEFKERLGIGSTIVAPLVYEKEVLGIMAVLNELSEADFTDEDIQLVESINNQASVALAQYELKQNIEHQAYHDALTGLPNRILFEDRLDQSIAQAKRNNDCFAVMFLDLDGFKFINDTYGHGVGDSLLQMVSHRLISRTRKQDTLARMGGDEFAVILNCLRKEEDIIRVAESFRRILEDNFVVDEHILDVGVSIGISLFPRDGQDAETLLARADIAMYQAKDSGRNRVCSFTPEISERAKVKLDLEHSLRHAIEKNELELYYQPQICLTSGKRTGVEALLRWFSKDHGFVSPAEFIPIAEENKLILEIGEWVLREACKQSVTWQEQGKEPIKVAVNISAIQFESPDFIDIIKSALSTSNLDPQYLELEVTESVVMQDVNLVIERLNEIRSMGISIAIDDFGTGYSSLQYLQKLPVDKLKIDRSFINEISENSQSPIVLSIMALGQSLGLTTVAEGVETKEQLDFLRMFGADNAQGYYFAKPMKATEI